MDLDALRRAAADLEAEADATEQRSGATTAALEGLAWAGPRRDAFMLGGAVVLGRQSAVSAKVMRALGQDLRALAAEAEEHAARLRRLEMAVRTGLDRLLRAAWTLVRSVERELRLLSIVAGPVSGLGSLTLRLTGAQAQVQRINVVLAALPPPGDIAWDAIGSRWAAGDLV